MISVLPILCQEECTCNYNQVQDANILTCRGRLPELVPFMTDWLTIVPGKEKMNEICGHYPYIGRLYGINLSRLNLENICDMFIDQIIAEDSQVRLLDISSNALRKLSHRISEGHHLEKIWLSGNRFECTCDMLWMTAWLVNTLNSAHQNTIQDFMSIKCYLGDNERFAIHRLTSEDLGCQKAKVPTWGFGLIITAGILIVVIIVIVGTIMRRWSEVQFLAYLHFNILNQKDDDIDELQKIYFDALLSYTYVHNLINFCLAPLAASI